MSSAANKCAINSSRGCPVASSCGIYLGLALKLGKDGTVEECNRYDAFTMTEKKWNQKWGRKA